MNKLDSHSNTHAEDTQYKHSHTFKTHLPSACLSAGGYSTRELRIISLFHVFEKIKNLEGETGTQLGGGFLRKHVYCSTSCVINAAGLRPLKMKLYCFYQSCQVDTGNEQKTHLLLQVLYDDEVCRGTKKY